MLAIRSDDLKIRWVQVGQRDRLLCADCEDFFNEQFEVPFQRAWYGENPVIPEVAKGSLVAIKGLDYAHFKLFHLSILWRAAVSTHKAHSRINLGPHEGKIRRMLLDRDPGEAYEYPVYGTALISPDDRRINHALLWPPMEIRMDGVRCYESGYGGVGWRVGVARHRIGDQFDQLMLREDGSVKLVARNFMEHGPIVRIWRKTIQKARREGWKLP